MSRFNPYDDSHWLAQELHIFVREARSVGVENIPVRHWPESRDGDEEWLAEVEALRHRFDTPTADFVRDVRIAIIPRYQRGMPEGGSLNRRLAGFRFHGESAYPEDQYGRSWARHRVPVSRDQLGRAGYVELDWLMSPFTGDEPARERLAARAQFLEQLCAVLEADDLVGDSKGMVMFDSEADAKAYCHAYNAGLHKVHAARDTREAWRLARKLHNETLRKIREGGAS